MKKTILEKIFLKPAYSVALINVPDDLKSEFTSTNFSDLLTGTYRFILAFYTKMNDLEKTVPTLTVSIENDGLLWIAYPKGKALQSDLNRDILHDFMEKHMMEGVSLVSLNETWSAMRFKKLL